MKACRTCKYSKFTFTDKGNIKRSIPGECTFNIKEPKMPSSVPRYNLHWPPRKTCIWPNDGKDCECYEGEK